MKLCQVFIIPLLFVALMLGISSSALGAASVSFVADTSAGWSFYELESDIAKNNTVDYGDLGIVAQQWLANGCGSANQWCAGADLDDSTGVDLVDYAILAKDWSKTGASNVLLQTIYGSAQNSAGQITANTGKAMSAGKGCAMAFSVTQATALDKGIFKCYNGGWIANNSLRIRLYNVTGKNYLAFSGHPTLSKAEPGGTGNTAIFDIPATIPNPVPTGFYHLELADGRQYLDMIINFGPLEVTAGEYLLVFDQASGSNTWGTMTRGASAPISDAMGKYGDAITPLPKRATVSVSGVTGNTFHYELTATADTTYTARSYLLAFQITTTVVNHAPVVNAGPNQTVQAPDAANLSGTATDDGLLNPLTTTWSKVSGPGTVTFGDASALSTTAAFSDVGTYVLRLTANDGALSTSDDIQIIYKDNHAPTVNAGADVTVGILDGCNLSGTATDDGLPNPPATVTTTWTQTSGPGTATFGNASNVNTSVSFSEIGTYVLRLTADDSDMSAFDEVTIEVVAGSLNNAPVVNAGSDQSISEGGTATLDGTVTDDGKPNPPAHVTTTWTMTSGPGTVTFGSTSAVDTTATFSDPGTYVLRLTASDSQLSNFDEVTVTVKAFGSYEGYGAGATGGKGGTVIMVTNLAASGAGSLQAALSASGARIIKFSVGGRIVVSSTLSLSSGNVTILGSTAPSPGITIDADNVSYNCLQIDASNVIIENMRFRNAGGELILVWGGSNLVFDHCSFTWNGDGALDLNGPDSWNTGGVNHVTVNRCLFGGAEELSRSHGRRITWMYNLFTTCNRRQPKIFYGGPDYNLQCNYIRKWCNTATHIQGGGGHINIINNYYGPPYPTENWPVALAQDMMDPNALEYIYTGGNVHAADTPTDGAPRGSYSVNNIGLATAPVVDEAPPVEVTLIDANDVPASVLASVGAQPTDSHDAAWITGSYTGRDHTIGGIAP